MNERAFDIFYPSLDTSSGCEEYADELGLSLEELDQLLAGKDVLDLGSGPGTFEIESSYKAKTQPDYVAPQKIDSLNRRYADPRYFDRAWETALKKGLEKVGLKGRLQRILDGGTVGEEAIAEAREHFVGHDWHDLDQISAQNEPSYDVILSVRGFPWYSDFSYEAGEPPPEGDIHFGPQCAFVFRKVFGVLRPQGQGIFTSQVPFEAMENPTGPRTQAFLDFCSSEHCACQIQKSNRDTAILRIRKAS